MPPYVSLKVQPTNNQVWSQHPAQAKVTSPYIPPMFPSCTVPVIVIPGGDWVVQRQYFPNGVIVIPTGCWPPDATEILPGEVHYGPGDHILHVEPNNAADMGYGGGCVFPPPGFKHRKNSKLKVQKFSKKNLPKS